MRSSRLLSLCFVACIILSSCGKATPSSPSENSAELLTPGNVTPEIIVNIADTEVVELTVEIVKQQNCGGSAEAENEHLKSHSVEHIIEAQGGFSVNVNGQIGFAGTDVELGATVAAQLGHSYGTIELMSRSLTVKARPGTNMEHSIRQTEIWKIGTANIKVGSEEVTIPFRFRHDFAIELVESRDVGCASLQATLTPTATEPPATATIITTPTSISQAPLATSTIQSGADPSDTGWQGEYFDNNNFQAPAVLTRIDPAPVFDWKDSNPAPGIPIDNFSIRWTRCLTLEDRYYVFTARGDRNVKVYVDNIFVLEAGSNTVERPFAVSGGRHCIRIDFYETTGNASIYFDFTPGNAYQPADESTGWKGDYFDNNNFKAPAVFTRFDPAPVFDWKESNPAPGISIDNFSIRWTRCLILEDSYYVFTARADRNVKVYVDDVFVLEAGSNTVERPFAVSAGQHCIRIDFYETTGTASVFFDFKPGNAYQPADESTGWRGDYFNNNNFQAPAAFTRFDPAPVFDWKESNPAPGIPIDNFSIRWTRCLNFEGREYIFTARGDRNVKVYVDDVFVLEAGGNTVERPFTVSAGQHCIRIDFYETTGTASVYFDYR